MECLLIKEREAEWDAFDQRPEAERRCGTLYPGYYPAPCTVLYIGLLPPCSRCTCPALSRMYTPLTSTLRVTDSRNDTFNSPDNRRSVLYSGLTESQLAD